MVNFRSRLVSLRSFLSSVMMPWISSLVASIWRSRYRSHLANSLNSQLKLEAVGTSANCQPLSLSAAIGSRRLACLSWAHTTSLGRGLGLGVIVLIDSPQQNQQN